MKPYAEKETEWRKEFLIRHFIPQCESIFDFCCGPGEYGPVLKQKCKLLTGLDMDEESLKIARKRNYDKLSCEEIGTKLPFIDKEFDCTWCSEVLEHFSNLEIMDEIERITGKIIIVTLPNPLSPHFKEDKTHILKYSVDSLITSFKTRKNWKYRVRGLGFNEIPAPLFLKKITTFVLYYIPWLSPTVAIIGERAN
jgi:ubiquinone/menaquinone biosynthesis C-methylase UbiE